MVGQLSDAGRNSIRLAVEKRFIAKSKLKYKQQFSYDKLIYTSRSKSITLVCVDHGEFDVTSRTHFKNPCGGCGECELVEAQNAFICQSNGVHKNKYVYLDVNYIDSHTHVVITCIIHGDFEQTPANHVRGSGCKACGIIKVTEAQTKSFDQFVLEANFVHDNKYMYTNYLTARLDVEILCPDHGSFLQTPDNHLHGSGCQKCWHERSGDWALCNTDDFIEKANRVHNLSFEEYDYSKVNYINVRTDVTIIHTVCGFEFPQQPIHHLKGHGCSQCYYKSEKVCRDICEELIGYKFPKVRPNFLKNPNTGRNLELDCFCSELNLAVEYNDHTIRYGYQSDAEFKEQAERDQIKQSLCKDNKTTLLYVPTKYTHKNRPAMKEFIRQELINNGYQSHIKDVSIPKIKLKLKQPKIKVTLKSTTCQNLII